MGESTTIVRDEFKLARIEIAELARGIGVGTALVATGAVLALLGTLAFLTGVVLLVGDQWLPADLYWVAALLVLAITGGLAVWLAKRGVSLLSPSELQPDETVTTLREDKQWLKQQLTSGATSS
ncbi:MAG TPA: phage holin family protein [Gemmatimonadaceae bacterium]